MTALRAKKAVGGLDEMRTKLQPPQLTTGASVVQLALEKQHFGEGLGFVESRQSNKNVRRIDDNADCLEKVPVVHDRAAARSAQVRGTGTAET
mmetsp:Transcript_6165/g.16439  ORF Transcript_6165/g.16439 Transcript_6165/m.16439 type:complete len:93 (+) Transcript_6165:1297-1575(+)